MYSFIPLRQLELLLLTFDYQYFTATSVCVVYVIEDMPRNCLDKLALIPQQQQWRLPLLTILQQVMQYGVCRVYAFVGTSIVKHTCKTNL